MVFSAKLIYFILNIPLRLGYTDLDDFIGFQMRILDRWPAWLCEYWYIHAFCMVRTSVGGMVVNGK